MLLFRSAVVFLALSLVPGCGALSAVSDASERKDAYTLSPATRAEGEGAFAAPGFRHVVVERPTSAGALATDRILIKPIPVQAQYLPDGRWSEPAPELVQTLLVASFQNLGGFLLVGRTGAGLQPDYTLMTEIQAFQAEPSGVSSVPLTIRTEAMMTVIRESDRRIVASRRFAASAIVASDDTLTVVSGFDSAMQTLLRDVVI
ncbi:MAG: membrane integrity-associated transporter subunit PqiC, partial [Rhodobacteraceae bacterium]|nr:membrane integrity-associated transporter subunit PqiC [Paracoccaceae bacterium]